MSEGSPPVSIAMRLMRQRVIERLSKKAARFIPIQVPIGVGDDRGQHRLPLLPRQAAGFGGEFVKQIPPPGRFQVRLIIAILPGFYPGLRPPFCWRNAQQQHTARHQ